MNTHSTMPQHRRPSFQPVQPLPRPPSMGLGQAAAGTAGPGTLPFFSFDTSSLHISSFAPPPPSSDYRNTGFFEDEPPLLEELGINTSHILRKTLSILNPIRLNADLHEDADLSGPSLLFLLFGLFQLLGGKLQFGVILGWIAVASLFVYFVFNMLVGRNSGVDLYQCVSYVGYSLLPMVIFSAMSLFLPRSGWAISVIACFVVGWCSWTCTSLLVGSARHAEDYRSLVAYSCAIIYTAFALLVLY